MPDFKFLTNHSLVLCSIARQPKITVREISAGIGITERTARNIIADLESGGYITKRRQGRRIEYGVNAELPLKQAQENVPIGNLLDIMGCRKHVVRKSNLVKQPDSAGASR
jgi:predicted transcriptional regulator